MYNGFLKKDEESEFIRMISAKLSLKFLLKQNKGNVWIYSVLQKKQCGRTLKTRQREWQIVNRPDRDYVQEDLEAFWYKQT